MRKATSLLILFFLCLPAVTWSQAAAPGPLPSGRGISDIDRLTRDRENIKSSAGSMGRLELAYSSSGDLKSSFIKTGMHSLRLTLEVNGKQIKKLAASKKPKLEEAVEPGPMRVKAIWSRPGTRLDHTCEADLDVGFKQVLFWPYGGDDGFHCEIIDLYFPDEVFQAWKNDLTQEQIPGYNQCATTHHRESSPFWKCIDEAGIPFPQRK